MSLQENDFAILKRGGRNNCSMLYFFYRHVFFFSLQVYIATKSTFAPITPASTVDAYRTPASMVASATPDLQDRLANSMSMNAKPIHVSTEGVSTHTAPTRKWF